MFALFVFFWAQKRCRRNHDTTITRQLSGHILFHFVVIFWKVADSSDTIKLLFENEYMYIKYVRI